MLVLLREELAELVLKLKRVMLQVQLAQEMDLDIIIFIEAVL